MNICSLANKCYTCPFFVVYTDQRKNILAYCPGSLLIIWSLSNEKPPQPPRECKCSFSRVAASCQYPWHDCPLYLIANHCFTPLGNRCGLNFELVDQIIIKQFSKVLRTYQPRFVGILTLNRWMLLDFLKFPTCKTPFTYIPINLCTNFYYCTSHVTWLHVCLPFSKLLNWGMPGRQQLLINDCLNEGLLTHDCIPTKQAFDQSVGIAIPLASEQCLLSSNQAWQN